MPLINDTDSVYYPKALILITPHFYGLGSVKFFKVKIDKIKGNSIITGSLTILLMENHSLKGLFIFDFQPLIF
jgi:hypothetical protein